MKRILLFSVLALGGASLFGSSAALAQVIPGQVAKGEPGWSCSSYKFVPGQNWVCSQWSHTGKRKLAPPPGFKDQVVKGGSKKAPRKSKSKKNRRR